MATLTDDIGNTALTDEEIAEGFEIVWAADINRAIQLVEATAFSDNIDISFMTTRDTAILRAAFQKLI